MIGHRPRASCCGFGAEVRIHPNGFVLSLAGVSETKGRARCRYGDHAALAAARWLSAATTAGPNRHRGGQQSRPRRRDTKRPQQLLWRFSTAGATDALAFFEAR